MREALQEATSDYTNNEINSKKITKPIRDFQLSLGGGGHLVKFTKFISNIILDLIRLLAIPYFWYLLFIHTYQSKSQGYGSRHLNWSNSRSKYLAQYIVFCY